MPDGFVGVDLGDGPGTVAVTQICVIVVGVGPSDNIEVSRVGVDETEHAPFPIFWSAVEPTHRSSPISCSFVWLFGCLVGGVCPRFG